MIRICIAFALCLAVSIPAIAAERWAFDKAAIAAGVTNAAASIIITCADGGLGLLYVVKRSALPADKRSRRKAILAFSDFSVSHRSTVELPLKTRGGQTYVAISGGTMNKLIELLANAPRKVAAGLGIPRGRGVDLFHSTEFSAAGSGAAIRAAATACKQR
jgi:hypothetical protein